MLGDEAVASFCCLYDCTTKKLPPKIQKKGRRQPFGRPFVPILHYFHEEDNIFYRSGPSSVQLTPHQGDPPQS